MIHRLISLTLIFLLLPGLAWAKTLREQVLRINPGTTVEVRLKTHETLRGKIGEVSGEEFELTQNQNGQKVVKKIAFSSVQSVHQKASKKKTAGYVVLGVVVGAAVLVAGAMHSLSHIQIP
jgi:hypothetical protein